MSKAPTSQEYLERVRSLLPVLRERAPHAEQIRRFPDESLKDFQELGLFRAVQPRRYGGYEIDATTFYRAVMEVGTVCGSSSWILGVIGIHNWQVGLFHPRAQEDVWGEDPTVQLSTSLAPTGRVERVTGGYRLSGRWSFSSGCDFCDWVFLGGILPPTDGGGPPDRRAFLLPRKDYVIDDNWQVVGLCGTGSKDIVVDEAFVPEHRSISYLDAFHLRCPGLEVNTSPLFRMPWGCIAPFSVVAPAVGIALGAVEAFREHATARATAGDRGIEDVFIQVDLAQATVNAEAARDGMLNGFDDLAAYVNAGQEIPLQRRARHRWQGAQSVATSIRAVDTLFEAGGARAIFLDHPLQRAWRDIHAVRAHANNNEEKVAALYARVAFGLPPQDIVF